MDERSWRDAENDLPRELWEVVDSARDDEPSDAALASLRSSLGPILGGGVGGTGGPGTPGVGGSGGAGAVSGGYVVGAIGIGVAVTVGVLMAFVWASDGPADRVAPVEASEAESVAESVAESEPEAESEAESEPESVAGSESEPEAPVVRRRASSGRDHIAEEALLLERARHSLAGDPSAALAAADEHRRRFRRGALAQEREVLAIDALVRLGRGSLAQRRQRAFLRRYPRSAHAARVRSMIDSMDR